MNRCGWLLWSVLFGLVLLWAGCQNPALTGAKVYIQQQDWDNAREQLEIAVQQEPRNAEAHFLLGRAYGEKGQYPEMVREFARSLEITPKWQNDIARIRSEKWTMAFNRGIQASKDEDFSKALEEFHTATIIDDQNPDAFNNLGYCYTNLDRFGEALQSYKTVLELDPDNVAAHINSGVIHFKQGQSDEAAKLFEGALAKDPANKSALSMWALSLETLARRQRQELADAAARADSLRISTEVKNTLNEAVQVYQRAIQAHPEEKNFHYNLGVLYAQDLNDYGAAAPVFQKVTEMDPQDVDAWYNLAIAQLTLNQLDGAQISLERSAELTPCNGDIWYQLGIIYVKKGLKEKGEKAFKKSEELIENPIKIEIAGTAGVMFSGSIGEDGSSRTVEGTIPMTYDVCGDIIVGAFQKGQEEGTLTVKILDNNGILDQSTTTASFGSVTVSHGE